jgi:hypothetical protein
VVSLELCGTMAPGQTTPCGGPPSALPTDAEYTAAVHAFVNTPAFSAVRKFTAWNEPSHPRQPTFTNPTRAGQYWRLFWNECQSNGCTVAAGDFLDTYFTKAFGEAYRQGMKRPAKFYAWHAYKDLEQRCRAALPNRWKRLSAFLDSTYKDGRPKIWLTEQGTIFRKRNTPVDEPRFSDTGGALMTRCLLQDSWRLDSRIETVSYYQWRGGGAGEWDSGLKKVNGDLRTATYNAMKNDRPTSFSSVDSCLHPVTAG